MVGWVFAYGSLVDPQQAAALAAGAPPQPVRLPGYRRAWRVAMRNQDPANDAKHFVIPGSGVRPDIYVAYVGIYRTPDSVCNGLLIPVDAAGLVELDQREVNYQRRRVRELRPATGHLPVWTYLPRLAAGARYRQGVQQGSICVSADYYHGCCRAFQAYGEQAWQEFQRSTEPPQVPLRHLQLVRRGTTGS